VLAWRSAKHQNTKVTPNSTRKKSTNMVLVEQAVDEMKPCGEGEKLSCTEVAAKHNVNRHTLARRCKGIQASSTTKAIIQQKFNPQ
jgi:hypothetical protein